jgi:hypothetical protein
VTGCVEQVARVGSELQEGREPRRVAGAARERGAVGCVSFARGAVDRRAERRPPAQVGHVEGAVQAVARKGHHAGGDQWQDPREIVVEPGGGDQLGADRHPPPRRFQLCQRGLEVGAGEVPFEERPSSLGEVVRQHESWSAPPLPGPLPLRAQLGGGLAAESRRFLGCAVVHPRRVPREEGEPQERRLDAPEPRELGVDVASERDVRVAAALLPRHGDVVPFEVAGELRGVDRSERGCEVVPAVHHQAEAAELGVGERGLWGRGPRLARSAVCVQPGTVRLDVDGAHPRSQRVGGDERGVQDAVFEPVDLDEGLVVRARRRRSRQGVEAGRGAGQTSRPSLCATRGSSLATAPAPPARQPRSSAETVLLRSPRGPPRTGKQHPRGARGGRGPALRETGRSVAPVRSGDVPAPAARPATRGPVAGAPGSRRRAAPRR